MALYSNRCVSQIATVCKHVHKLYTDHSKEYIICRLIGLLLITYLLLIAILSIGPCVDSWGTSGLATAAISAPVGELLMCYSSSVVAMQNTPHNSTANRVGLCIASS